VLIRKGSIEQLVYYWFQGRGRTETNEYLVKWFIFWDSLTRQRTDGALVRLTTVLDTTKGETAEADALLTACAADAVPKLERFVP